MQYSKSMKWLCALCFGLVSVLAGCGTRTTAADFTAGELLGMPTTIRTMGNSMKLESTPVLDGKTLRVQVRVLPALRSLTLIDVYVVTQDGVWRAPISRRASQRCGEMCLQGIGQGPSQSLRIGEGIQVIASLQDAKGQSLWLRDSHVYIKSRSKAVEDIIQFKS